MKKIKIFSAWFFGILALFTSLSGLVIENSFIVFVCFLGISFLLIPPLEKILKDKLKREIQTKHKVIIISGLYLLGSIVIFSAQENNTSLNTTNVLPPKQKQETINYATIRQNVKNLTDLQFDAFAQNTIGKILDDSFYVYDVEEKMFGGYSVSLDIDNPKDISISEVRFDAAKETAIQLTKNQKIRCKGTIKSLTSVFETGQVQLENTVCYP